MLTYTPSIHKYSLRSRNLGYLPSRSRTRLYFPACAPRVRIDICTDFEHRTLRTAMLIRTKHIITLYQHAIISICNALDLPVSNKGFQKSCRHALFRGDKTDWAFRKHVVENVAVKTSPLSLICHAMPSLTCWPNYKDSAVLTVNLSGTPLLQRHTTEHETCQPNMTSHPPSTSSLRAASAPRAAAASPLRTSSTLCSWVRQQTAVYTHTHSGPVPFHHGPSMTAWRCCTSSGPRQRLLLAPPSPPPACPACWLHWACPPVLRPPPPTTCMDLCIRRRGLVPAWHASPSSPPQARTGCCRSPR